MSSRYLSWNYVLICNLSLSATDCPHWFYCCEGCKVQLDNFNFPRIWQLISWCILKNIVEELLASPKFRNITDFPFLLHPANGGSSFLVKFATYLKRDTTSCYRSQKSLLRPLWEHESPRNISSGPSKLSVFRPALYRTVPYLELITIRCVRPHCFISDFCTTLSPFYRSQIPDLATLLTATRRMKTSAHSGVLKWFYERGERK
jgi:hypothetical protein